MGELAIQTTGLVRRYGSLIAVDNLSLEVPRGSIYGFLGPNGAGKTTTIRMLLGLIHQDAGEVRLLGQTLKRNRIALLSRVGALVEIPSIYPNLTGRENLEVTRRLRGVDKDRITRSLEIVRLEKDAHRKAKEYSLGMRQRLALALALMAEPELLILDEPTNGLDPSGIHEMRDLIRRLPAEHNATIFLSSHLLSEVEQVATHIGIVNKGSLSFQGSLESLHTQRQTHIAVQTDNPEETVRLIAAAGWQVQRNGNGSLIVPGGEREAAAKINSMLVGKGLRVFHLAIERPSLEDAFLKMTGSAVE